MYQKYSSPRKRSILERAYRESYSLFLLEGCSRIHSPVNIVLMLRCHWVVFTSQWLGHLCIRIFNLDHTEDDLEVQFACVHEYLIHMMTSLNGNISALLAHCKGNPPVTGGFHLQRPVTRNFDVFFDVRLNKRLSKRSRRQWFEPL